MQKSVNGKDCMYERNFITQHNNAEIAKGENFLFRQLSVLAGIIV